MIIYNHPQGSPEWLAARAGVITASRFKDARGRVGLLDDRQQAYVAAIRAGTPEKEALLKAGYKAKPTSETVARAIAGLPIGDFSDGAKTYAAMVAVERIAQRPLDPGFQGWAQREGHEQEPFARTAYDIETGNIVQEAGLITTDDGRFGYSSDGLIGSDGLLEIKTLLSADVIFSVIGQGDLSAYMDQCMGGLWLTGRQWIDLALWAPALEPIGRALTIHHLTRDETAIEALEADLMAFAGMVDASEKLLRQGSVQVLEIDVLEAA